MKKEVAIDTKLFFGILPYVGQYLAFGQVKLYDLLSQKQKHLDKYYKEIVKSIPLNYLKTMQKDTNTDFVSFVREYIKNIHHLYSSANNSTNMDELENIGKLYDGLTALEILIEKYEASLEEYEALLFYSKALENKVTICITAKTLDQIRKVYNGLSQIEAFNQSLYLADAFLRSVKLYSFSQKAQEEVLSTANTYKRATGIPLDTCVKMAEANLAGIPFVSYTKYKTGALFAMMEENNREEYTTDQTPIDVFSYLVSTGIAPSPRKLDDVSQMNEVGFPTGDKPDRTSTVQSHIKLVIPHYLEKEREKMPLEDEDDKYIEALMNYIKLPIKLEQYLNNNDEKNPEPEIEMGQI